MPDAEDISKRLTEVLKSDAFNLVLDAVYVEKGESVTQYLKEVYPTLMWLPQVYPSGEVAYSRSRRQNPDDYVIDNVYDFDVYFHTQGPSEERLQVELARYVRAVEDYFRDVPNLLPLPGCSVWTGDSDMSPISRFRDSEPFLKSVLMQVFVRAQR